MSEWLDEDSPDAEEFVVSWIAPVMRAAVERKTGEELPFVVVGRIAGADDQNTGCDDAVVQLDVYADGTGAASDAAADVHRRMLLLSRECSDVTLSDGTIANCDYCDTDIRPFRMPYEDDRIVRYTARYTLGLSYVAV